MNDNDSGPALPTTEYYDEKPIGTIRGMTLHDYFATHAMTGLAFCLDSSERGVLGLATIAYELADAMLKARQA